MKPLWAFAGVALLGTAGAVGVLVVASTGGEEEVVQDFQTATPLTTSTVAPSSTPTSVPATPTETIVSSPRPTSGTTAPYTDAISGFSLRYPAEWFIIAPPADPAIVSYAVTVSSYNPEKAQPIGVSPPSHEIKIDISVTPNPNGLSVEEWLAERSANADQGSTVISEEPSQVDGETALKRLFSLREETRVLQYIVGYEGKIYVLSAYTADSVLIGEFDGLISSFRFPR